MLNDAKEMRYRLVDGVATLTQDDDAPIVVLVQPSDRDCKYLTERLQIDEHTLQSALDPDETARLEFEPTHIAVIFKRPQVLSDSLETQFRTTSVGAFLFADRLIIVQNDERPLSLLGRPSYSCHSLRGVLLHVLYRAIVQFSMDVRRIQRQSEQIEERIEYSLGNRALSSMFSLQRPVYYRSASFYPDSPGRIQLYADRIGFATMSESLSKTSSLGRTVSETRGHVLGYSHGHGRRPCLDCRQQPQHYHEEADGYQHCFHAAERHRFYLRYVRMVGDHQPSAMVDILWPV